jgi:hypothetical protein
LILGVGSGDDFRIQQKTQLKKQIPATRTAGKPRLRPDKSGLRSK